ncbi:calcium-binding protein [Nostoc sp. FACHB-280]|uniref:calcium-binding protein n=1 Tax=Nostoc sp. FACHB-280 TaxID=2692839 RepID=UPI00168BCE3D|nr:calcium-binding protein [Nostoc sp. FACHB-280]MBD2496754.1 putative Ig domain-containing protein [Nostoc sp. FACHB-280]
MNQLQPNNLGEWRIQANPNNIQLSQAINKLKNNFIQSENGVTSHGKTLTQLFSEYFLDNPKVTDTALIEMSRITRDDFAKQISTTSNDIAKKRFDDYEDNPLQVMTARFFANLIAKNPNEVNQLTTQLLDDNATVGLTGPGDALPQILWRHDINDPRGQGTLLHDVSDILDYIFKSISFRSRVGSDFNNVNSLNKALWGYEDSISSAILGMFIPATLEYIQDSLEAAPAQPVTTTGMLGSYVGGKVASYFVDDTFANQLLAQSLGSTVTGWVGDTVEQVLIDPNSIRVFSLPNRFVGNLVSNTVALGTGEIAENIIQALEIENTLAQIGVNTLTQAIVDYAFTSVAVEYFPNFAAKYLEITNVKEITSLSLVSSYVNSLASYAGSEFYKTLVRWNIIGEGQLNQGSAIGGSLLPTLSSLLGFTSFTGPIGILVGTVIGSLIGGVFADEDFPRAAYVVNIVDGKFVTKFAYEFDDGVADIARQMGESAKEILNYLAGTVGGQLLSVENVYYGHYIKELVYQLQDDAPGGSSYRRRVGFGENAQAAIEAGVVYQLTKTQIEGGDRYIKRLFNNYTNSRSNLDDFNELLQIAKEYGTYLDNPTLYQEYINKLAANSIQDADKRITDLQSRPWDRFVPEELNDALIKEVAANLSPTSIRLSLEGNDLIINGERIYNWLKIQSENKIQFLRFADGSIYTINIEEKYAEGMLFNSISGKFDIDLSSIPKVKQATLKLYEKDPTIKDFGLNTLPSQVSLSLSGNNLIINGEIIANWLTNTNNRLEILRFADGSRFKIVVENNSKVKLENELVANWKTVLAKAAEFNLSTPQSSDRYKGNNVTKILYGSGGVVQGSDNSDDVLISSSAAETLKGGKSDDVYRYSLGSGKDIIEDIGGVDVIEFDSNIQLSNLQLQQSGSNLIINIINSSNPTAPITNQLTIKNFATNKIEFIRLGNNEEYFLDNTNGQWQLKPTSSVQTSTSSNTIIQGTIGADVLRGLGENDTLSGGAGNDTYLYSFGDGLNTTIYDTGDYEGKVRDGGIDTLVLGTNTIHSLKLQDKDLIITVSYVLPSLNANGGNNEAQPITITIKNWVDENSRIEFIRLANGKDFYPTLAADGSVSLQPVLTQGESTLDVQLDVPDSYALSSYKLAVVDLFGNGLQLISAQDSFAMSDLDNDGYLEQTGWVSPSDGILVIDLNNDGRITELNEFISLTAQTNVTAISSLNSNGDRLLNYQDTNFEKIRVWVDANGNRKVELGELAALHRYGIEDVSLASQQKNFEIAGNLVTASTYFTQLGYQFRKRSQIFDVTFAYNPNGVKLETLPGGINKFNFENKPDILIADDTAGSLDLTIDPTITYSVTGGKNNDKLTILASNTTGGILNGGAGDDTLTGAGGSDIINGGKGKDVIKAGAGDDTITVDQDDILTSLDGGEGFDIVTIDSDARFHLILNDINNIESIIGNKLSNQITYNGVKAILISGDLGNDTITGGEGDDQIEGGEGKDKLSGNKGKDLLLGGLDDDSLYGDQGDDQLYGQEGDDFLDGGDGSDIIDGGLGNDQLSGGFSQNSQNTFIFGRGYGIDTILANYNNGLDIISFKTGISPSDIFFWRNPNPSFYADRDNLYLGIKNTNDRIIIQRQFPGGSNGIDQFVFADGTIWTRENIQTWLLQSTNGDDYLIGYSGNDTLDGSAGNDSFEGGAGNNTYIFGRGYGVDTIIENYNTATDIVSFKAGISPSDIIFWRKPTSFHERDNLYIGIKNTNDRLIIQGHFKSNANGIDQFVFADGTIWTRENIQTWLLQSTSNDDYLIGDQRNDTLDGGAGNDSFEGGAGNNTYIFGRGYGVDTVVENSNTGTDIVSFKTGIIPSDIIFYRRINSFHEKDNLYIGIKNTNDRLIIQGHFKGNAYGIDQFVFVNGTTITRSDINALSLPESLPEDNLVSGDGNANILEDATGNDTLAGKTGNDTYIFKQGYGQDTIQEENSNSNYYDIVKFGAGLTPQTMEIVRQGDDLIFKVKGSSDRLTIKNQYYPFEAVSVEEFQFDNGAVVWTKENIKQHLLKSTDGDDYLLGYSWGLRNDILDGGLGNDTLVGGTGDDTYIFKQGYGQDVIQEDEYGLNSFYDIVKFGVGLTLQTIDIVRQGDDLIFKVKGSSDRLTIKNQFGVYEAYAIEEFQFDNGAVVWTKEDIKQHLLKSTDGDDYIAGYSWGIRNETLDGGLGNDTLIGGTGDDTYIFKLGYGQDVIQEAEYGLNSFYDIVKFSAGLTPQTMEIVRQGNDLIFKVKGSSDRLTIKNQFAVYEAYAIEEFQFDNGAVVWTKEDIKQYLLKSTDGDDYIAGYSEGINNETLDGGLGYDTLAGGAGNDTYIFKYGYGQDVIQEDAYGLNSFYDTVKFGVGLTPNIMDIFRQGNDLIFKVKNSNDQLTIKNQFDELLAVEEFQFDNGATIWTKADIKNYIASTLNNAPIVQNAIIDQTTSSNSPFNFTVPVNTFSDANIGDSLSYTATKEDGTSLPSWLTFNPITHTFTGTPTLADVGILNIKVVATDNKGANVSDIFAINIRNLTGTAGNDNITGTSNDDVIQGLGGNDTLLGLAGNDTIDGGTGQDTMTGGLDNDIYIVDNSADKVVENANEGTDTVRSSISYTLGDNIENLVLTGTSSLLGTGNTLNNLITGNTGANTLNGKAGDDIINGEGGNDTLNGESGNDTLSGGAGNDSLDGGAGDDVMLGGAGDDTYYTDSSNDQIIEVFNEGTDTVRSAITWTLGYNLENLILTGSNAINGTGNALKNSITGNTANNTLSGGDNDDTLKGDAGDDTLNGDAGNDSLDGGVGNDVMIGGVGNDTYYTDSINDQIIEATNAGTDTVRSAISWTLGNNLENLILTGSNAINGTGNALVNNITGNSANNSLSGGDNNDTLNGGDGDDILNGGNGNDTLIGGNGNDTLVGGLGNDKLTGGTGNDKFVFNSLSEGSDTITDFSSTDDVIVVQTLLANLNYTGINPIANGYIRGIQSGLNTLIQVDADGVGGSSAFSTLVTLNNFTATNFSQNNLIF